MNTLLAITDSPPERKALAFLLEECPPKGWQIKILQRIPANNTLPIVFFDQPLYEPGYIFSHGSAPAICAYHPTHAYAHIPSKETAEATKDHELTQHKNYRFWIKEWIQTLVNHHTNPRIYAPLQTIVTTRSEDIAAILGAQEAHTLYLDIETSRLHRTISCIGFTTDTHFPKVYVIPIYEGSSRVLQEQDLLNIFRAFCLAFARLEVVAHHTLFDLLILCGFYDFPYPEKVYDTMFAQHRTYPEAEKSLSHTMTLWCPGLPYHKDENLEPRERDGFARLYAYNAKDVYALREIHTAQLSAGALDLDLQSSFEQSMASILPYLDNTLTGLRFDNARAYLEEAALREEAKQSLRVIQLLLNNPSFNPGSPQQGRKFFYDFLRYEPSARTETGEPALGKDDLYALLQKYGNPVIPWLLRYRSAKKEESMLKLNLWKSKV